MTVSRRSGIRSGMGRRPRAVSRSRVFAALMLGACAGLGAPTAGPGLEAQTPEQLRRQAEQLLGRPISDQELLNRLRDSGMSATEVRRQLEQRGLDPRAADPYLGVLEGRAERVPVGTDPIPLLQVLAEQGGRQVPGGTALGPDGMRPQDPGPPVFGRELFRRATSQFEPVSAGPAPPDYRVGPGDQLILVITGEVELAYELSVSREGWIVIPDVGQLVVSGRTMDGVRDVLYQRLSQAYSGIRRGGDATTFFDVTLGRLRTNEVFVIGEVERPAAYPVSSLATVLTALYYAGGPAISGSFREAVVNRGGREVARIDLYDYLVRGRTDANVRLEHGDVVFVPVAERQVQVSGAVVRPGIYEFRTGEDLRDVLRFAGGVEPRAELRRVQIERVLPVEERGPGRDRAILDVPVGRLDDAGAPQIPLREGDRITVFAVLDEVDNEVRVSGGVWRPGTYAVAEGTRLWDVIESAGGLLPDVVEGRAQIQRLQPDWTRRLIPVALGHGPTGEPLENPRLEGRDELYLYAARDLREDRQVSIGGWVREPGVYPYVESMTVVDLILQAGGLRTGVYLTEAEVSRVVVAQERSEVLTESFSIPLDSSLVFVRSGSKRADPTDRRLMESRAAGFALQNMDAVYVRRAPGFHPQERVMVTGEVLFPGPYSISTRSERLSDLLDRAGGLTGEAYPAGVQLWRLVDEDGGDLAEAGSRLAGLAGVAPESLAALNLDRERRRELDLEIAREQDPERIRRLVRERDEIIERERDFEREQLIAAEAPAVARTRVGIDLVSVIRDPSSPANVLINPSDSIFVPGYIPTVDVRGAVGAPTKVLHRPGASFDYYIRQAGGYLEEANENRARLQFANGEVATRGRRFLFLGGGIARPDPGSVITVPQKDPREGMPVGQVVTLVSTSITAIATLILALNR